MKRIQRGFTLIELLVVIAILAVLAAVIFPVFAAARDQAKRTVCASNLKQIWTALNLYADDWEDTYPPNDNPPYYRSIIPDVTRAIMPYIQ